MRASCQAVRRGSGGANEEATGDTGGSEVADTRATRLVLESAGSNLASTLPRPYSIYFY